MRNKIPWALVLILVMPLLFAQSEKTDTSVTISAQGNPVLNYRYGDVAYKPYVEKLYTPNGLNVVRDSPEDHIHHHGLMFAVKVDDVNFWEEQDEPGREQHQSITIDDTGLVETIDWKAPKKEEVLLKEQRSLVLVDTGDSDATLLSWKTKFTVPEGKKSATLTGSHYHGLGMRFVESMDQDCIFRNKEGNKGKRFRGTEDLTEATWCAIFAKVDGKPVTVAMFHHPDNARPTTWFTMSGHFAYMSATMRYHEEPLKVNVGTPLTLRYGVALWDGHIEDEEITKVYQKWIAEK